MPAFLLTLALLSVRLSADSFAGRIVGLNCAENGHLCPLKKFEQHISEEPKFVLFGANKKFYLLNNISRDTLVRYVSNRIVIIGTLDEKTNTIRATELQVLRGDALARYESVWRSP